MPRITTITATTGSLSDNSTVNLPFLILTVSPDNLITSYSETQSVNYTASAYFEDDVEFNVTNISSWSSDDPTLAFNVFSSVTGVLDILPEVYIAINPSNSTVLTGAQQQYTASFAGQDSLLFSSATFSWQVSSGSISNNGLFTAPMSSGTVSLTATSIDYSYLPDAVATVTISDGSGPILQLLSATLDVGTMSFDRPGRAAKYFMFTADGDYMEILERKLGDNILPNGPNDYLDTFMNLYESGTLTWIAHNDDGGGGGSSLLTPVSGALTAGMQYIIEATLYSAVDNGASVFVQTYGSGSYNLTLIAGNPFL